MIDPKSLRIGNLVNFNNGEDPEFELYVSSVECDGINTVYDRLGWRDYAIPGELYGIPITPEWLERLGFKTFEYGENTLYNGHRPFTGYRNYWLRGFLNIKGYFCILGHDERHLNIEYVHQLQNLYHALTGTELTIQQ